MAANNFSGAGSDGPRRAVARAACGGRPANMASGASSSNNAPVSSASRNAPGRVRLHSRNQRKHAGQKPREHTADEASERHHRPADREMIGAVGFGGYGHLVRIGIDVKHRHRGGSREIEDEYPRRPDRLRRQVRKRQRDERQGTGGQPSDYDAVQSPSPPGRAGGDRQHRDGHYSGSLHQADELGAVTEPEEVKVQEHAIQPENRQCDQARGHHEHTSLAAHSAKRFPETNRRRGGCLRCGHAGSRLSGEGAAGRYFMLGADRLFRSRAKD